MGTMLYVLESEAFSPQGAAYAKCTDFGMTSRDAICGTSMGTNISAQFLDEPYVVYGTFLGDNTQKYVAYAEYLTSCRDKHRVGRVPNRSIIIINTGAIATRGSSRQWISCPARFFLDLPSQPRPHQNHDPGGVFGSKLSKGTYAYLEFRISAKHSSTLLSCPSPPHQLKKRTPDTLIYGDAKQSP
ncbi:hypothetical protein MTO96_001573 [Rhipicephalus appendiculatus]